MRSIPYLVSGTGPDGNRNYLMTYDHGYHSVDDYLARSDMAVNKVWGGDFLRCAFLHICWMLQYIPTKQTPTTGCVAY